MAGGQDPKWQKDAADQNFDYMFKLLIIGNSSVGKTSFLFRYADDSFTSAFVSTVGIDFKVKTVFRHDKRVKLQIWTRRSYSSPVASLVLTDSSQLTSDNHTVRRRDTAFGLVTFQSCELSVSTKEAMGLL
uniref:Uncharacterized protein n=1 Tax=Timema shepardi TaxID=629360 RepID=A0A7R9G2V0_TIMSH|nr:unnamed protein product [Timema shepardi]